MKKRNLILIGSLAAAIGATVRARRELQPKLNKLANEASRGIGWGRF